MAGKCIVGRLEHPEPRANLYVFPHSGGMPGQYLQWKRALPRVNVFGVQYPGRGSRVAEPFSTTIDAIVEDVMAGATFTKPSIFFGHSLGAIVAYEVASRVQPSALFVSAMSAPEFRVVESDVNAMTESELIDEISKMNPGLREELELAPELKDLFVRTLRADMQAAWSYRDTKHAPLDSPIRFFGGKADAIPAKESEAWATRTAKGFESHLFEGGHFYFNEKPAIFFSKLNEVIDSILEGRAT